MTHLRKAGSLALVVAACAIAGCNSLQISPQTPSSMPRAAGAPLSLRVGVAFEDQPAAGGGSYGRAKASMMEAAALGQGQMNAGQSFAEALRRANLFQEVQYPLPYDPAVLEGIDLVITGQFDRSYRQDPALPIKAMMTGFLLLLPAPFVTYSDVYGATGDLMVKDRSGGMVKQYNEKLEVNATYQLFSEATSHRQAPSIAVQNLVAKLVEALIQDRPFFARLGGTARAGRQRRESGRDREGVEPAAGQASDGAGEWWKQDSSEEEPSQGRASARREPSAEETSAPRPEAASPEEAAPPRRKPKPAPSSSAQDLLP